MFKRLSLAIVILTSAVFMASCKSKPKADGPVGGAEGGQLDSTVTGQNIAMDAAGSDSGNIAGLSTVHFEYDSSTIGTEARKQLGANADWIKNNAKSTVQIEGHCDSRGSVEYN